VLFNSECLFLMNLEGDSEHEASQIKRDTPSINRVMTLKSCFINTSES